MGTQCTTGTHATFIPPKDQRDVERAVLHWQAAVLKWMMDFPRDETDREDGSGLEFECQLNTPSLARLHQLKELGRTNIMALRRTLLKKQAATNGCWRLRGRRVPYNKRRVVGQSQSRRMFQAVHPIRKSMVGQTSRSRRMVRSM